MISTFGQQNESFDSKLFKKKIILTTESTTNSWEFWCFCKRLSNFYTNEFKFIGKHWEGYLSTPHHTINTLQRHICWVNSSTFSIFLLEGFLTTRTTIQGVGFISALSNNLKNKNVVRISLNLEAVLPSRKHFPYGG